MKKAVASIPVSSCAQWLAFVGLFSLSGFFLSIKISCTHQAHHFSLTTNQSHKPSYQSTIFFSEKSIQKLCSQH
jgi:hypothetical protein